MKIISAFLICLLLAISPCQAVNLSKYVNTNSQRQELKTPFDAICTLSEDKLSCFVEIDKGAYIYKDSLTVEANEALIEINNVPKGVIHSDLNGKRLILNESFNFEINFVSVKEGQNINLNYQGCDSLGICYPVATKSFVTIKDYTTEKILSTKDNHNFGIFKAQDNFLIIVLLCFVFGALLDLTPCLFPMLSVYSGMILGSKYQGFKRTLSLNLLYLLGLSITYCILGYIFSKLGVLTHSYLQHPIASIFMSLLLIVFALNCMGLVNIKVPSLFNLKIQSTLSQKQNGTFGKAFLFGMLSALITTPCTSAPLAGALIYVMNTNSLFKGMIMFFAIGLGMGMPLVLIGTYGAKFLSIFKNKANVIKNLLAIPLILAAFYISSHLFGQHIIEAKALVYAVLVAYFIGVVVRKRKVSFILSIAAIAIATFAFTYLKFNQKIRLPFVNLTKFEQLNNFKGRPTLISIGADWCTNCHALDEQIYSSEEFINYTKGINKVRFDFTDPSTQENQKLAKKLQIVGVPYLAIFDKNGNLVFKHVGTFSKEELFEYIDEIK